MRSLPFHGQGKRGSEAGERVLEGKQAFWRVDKRVVEPRSVLDHRSPSPPTSTATLSSSLGGSGSTDTAGVAAVSGDPTDKWGLSDSAAEERGGAGWKEEWAAELQAVPSGLEAGGAKCGLGVDDWETMLSQDSLVSPVREQSFLGCIVGDGDDDPASARFKQHLLTHGLPDFDVDDCGFGLGILDSGNGSIEDVGGGFPFTGSNSWVSPPSNCIGIKGTTVDIIPQNDSQLISPPLPPAGNFSSPFSFPPGIYLPEPLEDKLQLFSSSFLLNQQPATPNPSFFLRVGQAEQQQLPPLLVPTQPKCHLPIGDEYMTKLPFLASGGSSGLFHRRQPYEKQQQHPGFSPQQLQQRPVTPKLPIFGDDATTPAAAQQKQLQQALVDLLTEAAKMVEARNFAIAHGILARLNHQLPSPVGKSLIRSAFYFKEALQHILCNSPSPDLSCNLSSHHQKSPLSSYLSAQFDIVHKLSAYKTFSEVSPIVKFSNFTCVQALLEELSSSDRIHIVDFDIGVGGQWSSFMQELAQRCLSSANPLRMLKITVLVPNYSQDNLELHLVRDNLTHFASDLNIPFEFYFQSLESFDALGLHVAGGETIAVNLPVGFGSLPLTSILCLVKKLSPKIVVSVDQGCNRNDLPFWQHFLHTFQSTIALMDSIDASGTNQDMTAKMEKFLLQPRIESSVLRRYLAPDKILPWRTIFTTSGERVSCGEASGYTLPLLAAQGTRLSVCLEMLKV
ncbi:uncharacterized protein LOC141817674 isoform X2 [Curcuma longa]|uniref:uncharacterized protein LOC141817674 isoform X2 n=1 Tax=Curcuma longa TaxID=136217 RepID=UPI003D9F9D62